MCQISVILPTYNRAAMVGEAISSVLNQTYIGLELIVVDDGSTDQTSEIVSAFDDPRLKYLKQPNGGTSAARNSGFGAATGEFIAFLDSDDLYLPDKLAMQMAKAHEDGTAGLIYGDYYSIFGTRKEQKLTKARLALNLQQLLLGPAFHTSTLLIRRLWLEQVGGFDEQLAVGEEWELGLRLALAGCPMVCVSAPLSIVRMQSDRLTRGIFQHTESVAAVLDRIFQSPQMPKELLDSKDLSYISLYARHAAAAYLTGHPQKGQELLGLALHMIDPTPGNAAVDLLMARFVNTMISLSQENPREAVQLVEQHLPSEGKMATILKQKLWGRYHLECAFRAYALGQRVPSILYSLEAIIRTPSYRHNRGLIANLLHSLLGDRLFAMIKNEG